MSHNLIQDDGVYGMVDALTHSPVCKLNKIVLDGNSISNEAWVAFRDIEGVNALRVKLKTLAGNII